MGRREVELGTRGRASGDDRSLNNRSSFVDGALACALIFVVGTVALATPVVLRSETVSVPTLRAALEMMTTLFALAGAWFLSVQFASSRRLRDLLLLAATLVLGLINFAMAALPAALDLHHGSYVATGPTVGMAVRRGNVRGGGGHAV